jgi:hypothetical protein
MQNGFILSEGGSLVPSPELRKYNAIFATIGIPSRCSRRLRS